MLKKIFWRQCKTNYFRFTIIFGGAGSPIVHTAESWNGTNWTEENDLSTARNPIGGAGSSGTNAIAFGVDNTINIHRRMDRCRSSDWCLVYGWKFKYKIEDNWRSCWNSNSSLAFGGEYLQERFAALTESWDGTSWTEVNDLNTGRV